MPIGPKGEKRPADVVGNAVRVMRIATGEEDDTVGDDGKDANAKALSAKGGKKRAENMTPERRAEIARKASALRETLRRAEVADLDNSSGVKNRVSFE